MKHACEVVTAHFYFGSQICGIEATKRLKARWGSEDEVHICDEHYAEYFGAFLEREYTYYQMIDEEGT